MGWLAISLEGQRIKEFLQSLKVRATRTTNHDRFEANAPDADLHPPIDRGDIGFPAPSAWGQVFGGVSGTDHRFSRNVDHFFLAYKCYQFVVNRLVHENMRRVKISKRVVRADS